MKRNLFTSAAFELSLPYDYDWTENTLEWMMRHHEKFDEKKPYLYNAEAFTGAVNHIARDARASLK